MSGRSRSRRKDIFVTDEPLTKAEKRAMAKVARAKAAAARRRRRAMAIGAAWLAGIVAVAAVVVWWVRRDDDSGTTAAEPTPTPSASCTGSPPAAGPTAAGFPSLPPGADPQLGTKPTVTAGTGAVTELKITPIVEGTGPAVQNGQKVTVNYVGVCYGSGDEFDSSWKNAKTFDFTVGQGGVIKGWDQGLVNVKVGSRVQLDIPADLAYGDNPEGGQPGGPLRFVVDVLAAA